MADARVDQEFGGLEEFLGHGPFLAAKELSALGPGEVVGWLGDGGWLWNRFGVCFCYCRKFCLHNVMSPQPLLANASEYSACFWRIWRGLKIDGQ
jgi:hypothetical protein